MDTTQSTAKPWTKRGSGYVFIFKAIPLPEGHGVVNAETQEPNKEVLDEMAPVLMSSLPIFQIIFYKEDETVLINDIYKCLFQGYQDTIENVDLNEKIGLLLDALRNTSIANKHIQESRPPGVHPALFSFLNNIIEEGSLGIGLIVNTQNHLCFLKLEKTHVIFLPSSKN